MKYWSRISYVLRQYFPLPCRGTHFFSPVAHSFSPVAHKFFSPVAHSFSPEAHILQIFTNLYYFFARGTHVTDLFYFFARGTHVTDFYYFFARGTHVTDFHKSIIFTPVAHILQIFTNLFIIFSPVAHICRKGKQARRYVRLKRTNPRVIRLSLNRSQWGGCSTKHDTPTQT